VNGAGTAFDANTATGPNGDGISDALELLLIQIGCRAPLGPENDVDLDGLPDYFEVRSGTRALDPDSPLANGGADSDDATGPAGDFISDALEALLIARGASGPVTLATDTDGDGVPDFFEVVKGSDPFDATNEIRPGTKPIASSLSIGGVDFLGRTLTGTYRYEDAERDPEGATSFRWLRDGIAIPGELTPRHTIGSEDLGKTLDFEVTPVALYSWPPETQSGVAVRTAHAVPVLAFPRGAGGPGGVGVTDGTSDVRLWLRAEEGITTQGGEVTKWSDQSGGGRNAEALEIDRRPDPVNDVGPRHAPAVRFDGASHMLVPTPVDTDFTLAAVFATASTAGNPNQTWWATPAILGGEVPNCKRDYHLGLVRGRPLFVVRDSEFLAPTAYSDGQPHALMGWRRNTAQEMGLYVDGITQGTIFVPSDVLNCPPFLFIGSSTRTIGFWTGNLLEVFAYNRVLNELERNLVDTYLAAKHGIPSSLGLYGFADTHGGDVAGIGRISDTMSIAQAEGPGIMRVSSPSALSDGDYLVWGTDRPGDFSLSADVPPPFQRRLKRAWAYTITDGGQGDGVGTVNLRFRVKGLFLSTAPQDFALLFDQDGNFADAELYPVQGVYDPALEAIEFTGVPLAPARFISLAVVEPP